MTAPIFITGIGTGVGKTVVSAIITEALKADYWKPVQAGFEEGTDALTVGALISNAETTIHAEAYNLALPASPHIAAKAENKVIEPDIILHHFQNIHSDKTLIVEGAGGLLVPLSNDFFIADLIKLLKAKVILVSRNYLGSINHSLLTAAYCKQHDIPVLGWMFNDQYMNYESEIAAWTGLPVIGTVPLAAKVDSTFIQQQAALIQPALVSLLHKAQ